MAHGLLHPTVQKKFVKLKNAWLLKVSGLWEKTISEKSDF